ncbi:MAG: hypothetical protein K2I73_05405 [Eubacterium sp.]|nr:hypothetical protein [Eubacterium sp.]
MIKNKLIALEYLGVISLITLPPSSGRAGKIFMSKRIKFISSFKIKYRTKLTSGPHNKTINSFALERLFLYLRPIP